ncbi:MAG TPA: hypothetical protein VG934_02475 [Candidatus Paceibacterota bacterium]|nr:hypothetical protein [Candidatus Paceibacterota bacterium]
MEGLPSSITLTIAVLTVFLVFITALKYGIEDNFKRTRLIMTAFFLFIVATLTIAFRQYTMATLPFSAPAFLVGAAIGYFVGVRTAQEKLMAQGAAHYMEHFAHVRFEDLQAFNWWALVNFYSVMSALVLINLVGLSTVIFRQAEGWAIGTSALGALLLGTIAPYLLHLWSIRTTQATSKTTNEA